MPLPTTKVLRSEGSRLAGRVITVEDRAGAVGVIGVAVFAAGENGGRDMSGASLDGIGRKGGTPRPLSNGKAALAVP
jgi:hypothetical protein